jgi:CheY-like chemotaxis protein
LKMPRRDGFAVINWIRSSAQFQHLPVAVFTTSETADDKRRASELGASVFLTKTASCKSLIDYLRSIVAP